MNIILPFVTPKQRKKKHGTKKYNPSVKKIIRVHKIIKIHVPFTPVEIQNMDDQQVEYLYEHGTPSEREISGQILRSRKNWDTIINKSLDDPLPAGSGQPGAPEASKAGSSRV